MFGFNEHYEAPIEYCDDIEMMRTSPYPIYPAYRGQPEVSRSPFTRGNEEFYPQEYERYGLAHPDALPADYIQNVETQYASSQPHLHRVEGTCLDHGRVLTNPSRIMAPVLVSSIYQDGHYGLPADIEDSCPTPMVQRSFGQWTASPHDMVHTTPKAILDYDYAALSQQDIADRAKIALRKAMYGQ